MVELPRRAILTGIPTAVIGICTVLPAAPALAAPVDPVFALIEQHKAALADWTENHSGKPTEDAVWDAMQVIMDTLLATVPTTAAGAHAFLGYALENVERDDDFEEFKLAVRSVLASPVLAGGANV